MPNITHPSAIKYVEPGQNQISASGYNGLVQAAQRVQSFRRGVSNESDIRGDKDSSSIRHWIRLIAHDDIPAYSIVTIEPGGDAWSLVEPVPLSAQFSLSNAQACVFIPVGEEGLFADADYYLPVCDFAKPHIFKYDPAGGTPQIGNRIGPKYGSYKMSLDGDNLSFTVISPADTTDELVWCIKACQSATVGINIQLFEFVEPLHPGHVAGARRLVWNSVTELYEVSASDTKEYQLFDPEETNFFLTGERTHAVLRTLTGSQGGIFSDAEIIGEHGLHRKVKVYGDVECGAVGETTVWTVSSAFKNHPPTKYPSDPDCVITNAGTDANLRVCNNYGYKRKILDGEYIDVDFDIGRQAWIFDQEDRGILVSAVLDNNMCAENSDVTVSQAQLMDWKIGPGCTNDPVPSVTNAKNSKKLEALANATVFLRYYEGKDEWHIVEVEHRTFDLIRPGNTGQGDCPDLSLKMRRFSVMTCFEFDSDYISINSYAIPVVNDINVDQNCSAMAITWRTVCVFDIIGGGTKYIPMGRIDPIVGIEESNDSPEQCSLKLNAQSICGFMPGSQYEKDSIDFDFISVGTGISENLNCVDLDKTKIPVLAGCAPVADNPETIICLIDCEDTPTTVLTEADSAGIYYPQNKQIQPYNYDNGSYSADDIAINLPTDAVEGEIISIVNNGMSDLPVLVNGGGNNVQAITAPYTAASVQVWGPKISIMYQLRRIAGANLEWRIV